jgi:proline dehydrogenase
MPVMRTALLAAAQNAWLRDHAMRWRFVRRATRRFMPGETLDEALVASRELEATGIPTILTRLGENLESAAEAEAVTAHYLEAHERVRSSGVRSEMSIKLTQLGLDLDPELAYANLERIAARAASVSRRLWIDMEGSAYTQRTLALFRRAKAARLDVGLAIQAYLRTTAADIESLVPLGAPIRLVKGAYDEPEAIALRSRAEIDESFFRLGKRLLASDARAAGGFVAFGTHDDRLIERLLVVAREAGAPPSSYEIEMLYGIRRELQSKLVREGHAVRVLISYGEAWFPWYMRRLAEKPSNVGFVLRGMLGG